MDRQALLTMLYSLQTLLDKEMYTDAKELVSKIVKEAENEK